MKRALSLLFSILTAAFVIVTLAYLFSRLLPPRDLSIAPVSISHAATTAFPTLVASLATSSVPTGSILGGARVLVRLYGSRPSWQGKPFAIGESVPNSEIPAVISHLIACESGADTNSADTDHIDSNGIMSYGILQFQKWASDWEASSGLTGSPDSPQDAIRMATWALEHGMLARWSCAGILGIVK